MTLRSIIFGALGPQGADVSGRADGDVRGMLLAVGGASTKTRSGIDLTKAAAALQVSRRTVERWVRAADTGTGQRPSPAHAKTLAAKSRQAATTQAGRRQTIAQSPMAQKSLASGYLKVQVQGFQGPAPTPLPGEKLDTSYMRNRTSTVEFTDPEQIQGMWDAYAKGGDKGLHAWMERTWGGTPDDDTSAAYLTDWKFESIDGIEFFPRS